MQVENVSISDHPSRLMNEPDLFQRILTEVPGDFQLVKTHWNIVVT